MDESLLDLFRQEAAVHTSALDEALAALAINPNDEKEIAAARQAAHALLGAALLVGLEIAVPLAQAMENLLISVPACLPAVALAALRRASEWLRQISTLSATDLANPPAALLATREACLQQLLIFAAAETPLVLEKKQPDQSPQLETRNPKLETTLPPPETKNSKLVFNLLDLYRAEAETQLAALAEGLVELEGDLANPKKIEPIMRAAHSLKGAARIIGLDLAVALAHALEDALVAAQQGRLTLDAAGIDALLRAGDWLAQFSKLPSDQLAAPPPGQCAAQAACLVEMQAILAGGGSETGKTTEVPEATKATEEQPPPSQDMSKADSLNEKLETRNSKLKTSSSASADSVVRVSAASLSRLMGLAAETLVESRRLEPFRDRLLKLKNDQLQFVSKLEAAQAAAAVPGAPAQNLEPLRAAAQATLEGLRAQLENFDHAARRTTQVSGRLYQEVIASRLRPFADGAQAFPRLVRDVARALGKQVRLEIAGRDTPVDRDILEKLEAPLSHLLRNACDHGLETPAERLAAGKPAVGVIRLEARHRAGLLVVQVSDDGRGIALPRLRQKIIEQGRATSALAAALSDDEVLEFLFLPGFSTAEKVTEISGRGVGLDVRAGAGARS